MTTLESIQNVGGSIGEATAPPVTGLIVQQTHAFSLAFELAGSAVLLSGISYALVLEGAYDEINACTKIGLPDHSKSKMRPEWNQA